MSFIKIDKLKIGKNQPPYVVAEISANHNGDIDMGYKLIEAAKNAGASAIKLQTYTPDTITLKSKEDDFMIKGGLWDGYSLYDLYQEAHTPFEWHKPFFDFAHAQDITCFSSPFDETAVDLLEDLNCPAYKIASFEAIDLPLIRYASQTKKPLIISTGMANLEEIEEAVATARDSGCQDLILLHCISAYPAPIEQSNLRTIVDLERRFQLPCGLSDHTLGTTASIAAIALGAVFIEKHFTLSRENAGPDSSFSLEPDEFSFLCKESKSAWLALGEIGYTRKQAELQNLQFRRSLYFIKDLNAGDTISVGDVKSIRPGFGIKPKFIDDIIGKKVNKIVHAGTAVNWNDIV